MKKFLKLLLSIGLIFIAATAFTRNESLCYQKSKYVIPMHYDVKLTAFIKINVFYGEYNISISILNKTQGIYLHSEEVCIEDIVLITNFERYHENDKDIVYKPTYTTEEDTLYIAFTDELSPGNYTLYIKYIGSLDEVFRIFDVNEETTWVGALHFQIIGAQPFFRELLCLHLHDLWIEATFKISIRCDLCTALSNMPLQSTELDEHNMVWRHYDITPVMWTGHATMIVSNYLNPIDIKTRNIKMWCRFGVHMKFAKNVAENITLFFKNEWKHSNNISMVTHVAIPNFHDKGTTVFGLVLYRETDIIYDKNLYPVAHKFEVAQLVGRKVTQQWFIDMLNNPLVSNTWFKEGLITLLATYAVNETYPDYQIMNLFVVQSQHYSFNLDGDYHMWPSTSQIDSSLKIPNYIRAPFILHMMEHALTKNIFWKGIRSYINSTQLRRRQSIVYFWDEIVAAAENQYIARLITRYWHTETHCPIVKIIRKYKNITNDIKVSIQNLDKLKIDGLPVTFTTQVSHDFNNFNHYMVYRSKDLILSIPFSEYGWIIFNVQQIGYYRVNYDEENWQRITNYLHSYNYKKIHVLNRAQIIDDAFNLMIAAHLHPYIFWNIISYLHQEEDYIAWYPLFKVLEYICSTFPVLKDKIEYFTKRISDILNHVLRYAKYEEIGDVYEFRICLRQEAAKWACLLNDITCKKEANRQLLQHFQNSAKHELLPWWKEWTYCNALKINSDKLIREAVYLKGFEVSDAKFLEYLACSEDTDTINHYLLYKPNTKEHYQYSRYSFLYIITKHANNQTILKNILDAFFFNVKPKHIDVPAALIIIINNVYSVNLTQEISKYVQWMKYNTDIIYGVKGKDFIKKYFDKIESKITIRNNQIKRQIEYYGWFFF